jgi:hypothetical protein
MRGVKILIQFEVHEQASAIRTAVDSEVGATAAFTPLQFRFNICYHFENRNKVFSVKFMDKIAIIFVFFTDLTMKNVVFWDIKPQFVPHRRHITSPLQSPAS